MKTLNTALMIMVVSLSLFSIFQSHHNAARRRELRDLRALMQSTVDLSKEAQQQLAQGYFRLGVATAKAVIMAERIAGRPMPDDLIRKCIEHDIKASKGDTLLKLP